MIRRKSLVRFAGGALLALTGCAPQVAVSPSAPAGSATITPADMFARIEFLASDALRGRDTPSPGLEAAAAYIVSEYRRLGLEPAGENGTYFQRYPFQQWSMDMEGLHLGSVREGGAENRMMVPGTDFFAAPGGTRTGDAMGHARLVWVGELGEAGLPQGEYAGSAPIVSVPGAPGRAWNMAAARARTAARQAGASALLVVVGEEFPEAAFRQLAAQSAAPRRGSPPEAEIPVFYLTRRAAAELVGRSDRRLVDLPATSAEGIPLRGVSAHFAAVPRLLPLHHVPNVAAVIRGSDPQLRDEYVVLSAHMDHVGVGMPVNGDSIFNGADDNASGTAGLLEIAEAFASLPAADRPRRSIILLHVSGEEKGLLGSRYYADNPTVPVEQIVANINVDMIGRNSPDSVVVIGKDYSSLGEVVNRVNGARPELGLVASDDIWPEERFFFRSDHFNFARREIPSIFFFTGVHEDYHRPSDTVDKIDTDKASRIARLIYYITRDIANDPRRPEWVPEGLEEVRSLTR